MRTKFAPDGRLVEALDALNRALRRFEFPAPAVRPGAMWPELDTALHTREVRLHRAIRERLRAELLDVHARVRHLVNLASEAADG
ncbi:hypothetical protein R5W23_003643 [Gemmata sp. JC673]|uniref:Uncharacterized protein n=1 Tax=Gemmata algarum TaxID=2975278 RepID=A0ABU5F3W8_9BACT|nr:hypothetical protein [Gemmata algarum]MDY3562194.1 hypothetical protein [Gemmata algarum]